ncbi:hypothetical protein PoB_001927600 [Plakobranchus ocellatus]|uniref:Uncharacterized protein n=1 Tax=Plakobranchus ocellatus TaxID=259542 RepID=A0AAV3ZDQ6_9GAST|nr:hypothetical protein PoB_001927600 [Plakobranchus ocellatus]
MTTINSKQQANQYNSTYGYREPSARSRKRHGYTPVRPGGNYRYLNSLTWRLARRRYGKTSGTMHQGAPLRASPHLTAPRHVWPHLDRPTDSGDSDDSMLKTRLWK